MAIYTDVIVADPSEAEAILAAGGQHSKRWDCLQAKSVDPVKLGTLSAILKNESPDEIGLALFMQDALLVQTSDDGPWIYRIPNELVTALTLLDADAIEQIAEHWAQTEELIADRWTTPDAEEYLADFTGRAKSARAKNKGLLLWVSV